MDNTIQIPMHLDKGKIKRFSYLDPWQLGYLVAISILLWFSAASAVRVGAPLGMFGPLTSLLSFSAGIPIGWISVVLIIKLLKLQREQIVPAISFGLGVATCLDGIALTWATPLYGIDPLHVSLGAAWILWGVAAFTFSAFLEAFRR
jgi:hypothetical protein